MLLLLHLVACSPPSATVSEQGVGECVCVGEGIFRKSQNECNRIMLEVLKASSRGKCHTRGFAKEQSRERWQEKLHI